MSDVMAPDLPESRAREKTGAAEKIQKAEPMFPAVDCDLLYGVAAIGRWIGLTRSQVKPLIEDETLPTFRPPGRTIRCALKSELNETFRDWRNRR